MVWRMDTGPLLSSWKRKGAVADRIGNVGAFINLMSDNETQQRTVVSLASPRPRLSSSLLLQSAGHPPVGIFLKITEARASQKIEKKKVLYNEFGPK